MINRTLRQEDWDSLSITSRHYFTRERSYVIALVFFFQIDMRSFLIEHIELPIFHCDFFRYFLILLWFVIIIIIVNKSKWKRNTTFLKSFIKSIFSPFCCWFANKKAISHVSLLPVVTTGKHWLKFSSKPWEQGHESFISEMPMRVAIPAVDILLWGEKSS